MGHSCRICGRSRPNERFSGGGHRIHVCSECRKLPIEKRRAIEAHAEIEGFLDAQAHISRKNVARLKELSASKDPAVSEKAAVMLEVARIAPFKRRRFGRIRSAHPELWRRLVAAGLAWPEPEDEGPDASLLPVEELEWEDDDEEPGGDSEVPF